MLGYLINFVHLDPGSRTAEESAPASAYEQIENLRRVMDDPACPPLVLSRDTVLSLGLKDTLHRAQVAEINMRSTKPWPEMHSGAIHVTDRAGASAPLMHYIFWHQETSLTQPASPRLLASQSPSLMDEIAIPAAMQSLNMNAGTQQATDTDGHGVTQQTKPIDIRQNVAATTSGPPLAELSDTEVLSHLARSTRRINTLRDPTLVGRVYNDNWLGRIVNSQEELDAMESLASMSSSNSRPTGSRGGLPGYSRHGFSDDGDAEYSINSGDSSDSDDGDVKRESLTPETARRSWRIQTVTADVPIPSVDEVYASPAYVPVPVERVFPGPTANLRHQQMLRIQRLPQPQSPPMRQARDQLTHSPLRTSFSANGYDEDASGSSTGWEGEWTPSSSPGSLTGPTGGRITGPAIARGRSPTRDHSERQSARHTRRRGNAPYPVDGQSARQSKSHSKSHSKKSSGKHQKC
ncbi:hypothetical protein CMQ_5136 [Grosmannia clavigera kw1407]|uniref:Uncharacterized protein n=1 Tax=Grosmannia clavigera (strain kw1407 / UAMH 11150) TaxID=655863 RepID=F0XBB5_GROCL|nr:uncharacterized protein CMQ_5136 [Grosmannia clavigera kw1407]EFX04874.1 hypothetical protein CMQ_5136 [Grosmannia clavigera kw1407]